MTITTSCPTCMSLFRLPTEFAGRQVRCQKCENTFLVPEFNPGSLETTAGISAVPVEANMPVAQPVKQMLVAEPVEVVAPKAVAAASPPIEIVETEPAPAPPSPAKPVDAPAVDAPKPAVLVPSPAPPRWAGLVALAGLLFLGLLAMSASVGWVARHLDARRTIVPSRIVSSSRAVPIELGRDGRLTVIGQTRAPDFVRDEARWRNQGPFELYDIHLEQGKTYNFSVSGATISPRLQVYDGRFTNADRRGIDPENKLILAYQARRTGSHLLFISSSQHMEGDFLLSVAVQRPAELPPFDLTLDEPSMTIKGALGLEDSLAADINTTGVTQEYRVTLERNREYSISLASDEFNAKLHIFDRNNQVMEFVRPWNQPNDKAHTFSYRPNFTGEHRIRVTGDRFGLGAFTLRVADTSNVRPVQSVLVVFQNGVFEDRRSFVQFDPNEPTKPGLGPYKEYVARLEGKQRYRIELKSAHFGTTVTVHNDRLQLVAGDIDIRNQPLEFTPAFGGQYHIRVIGENRKARGEYQLRIEQLP